MTERIKLTEEFFQELEEFRMIQGIDNEEHPLYKILAYSKQILDDQKKAEKLEQRWSEINVDLDAPEDCLKFCITFAHYIRDGRI